LIEIATWNGPNINRTSNKLALRSEASSRYEKSLSQRLPMEAQALTSKLMVELCGATPVGGTIDVGGPGEDPRPIRLRNRRAEHVLVGRGLFEIAGWSFTEPALLDRLRLPADSHLRNVVTLENPLSEAQSILRPSILGSLLDAAQHNLQRGMPDLGLFESGT